MRSRRAIALAVGAMGIVNVVSALFSHAGDRMAALRHLVPTDVLSASRTYTLLAGVLLCVTAWGLWRGKRRAFLLALFLAALSVPVNFLKAADFEEATAAAVLLFALGANAHSFRVKSAELTAGRFRRLVAWALGLFAIYAIGGMWWLKIGLGEATSLMDASAEAGRQIFGLSEPKLSLGALANHEFARIGQWFLGSLQVMGITLVGGLAVLVFRPVAHAIRRRDEIQRVEELVKRYGESSISVFALSPESDYFLSPNGRAVIAYQHVSGTLLAIGDPIGPPEERVPLLREFAQFCREHEWSFGFFQARRELLGEYASLGWRSLHIGEDPIVRVERFTLEGSAMGDVRRSVRKLSGRGIRVRHFRPGTGSSDFRIDGDGLLSQLAAVSEEWLRGHPGGEKGFCMSRFDPRVLQASWVAVAQDPSTGHVEAFVSWVPIPARNGWALDLMRRRSGAPPGIMEYLVADSASCAHAAGDALLSLSLSPLVRAETHGSEVPPARSASATPGDPGGDSDMPRVREFLMRHLGTLYDFEGLFRWKRKFNPDFEHRYVVYPSSSALAAVAVALARAQTPGGLRGYLRQAIHTMRSTERNVQTTSKSSPHDS